MNNYLVCNGFLLKIFTKNENGQYTREATKHAKNSGRGLLPPKNDQIKKARLSKRKPHDVKYDITCCGKVSLATYVAKSESSCGSGTSLESQKLQFMNAVPD